MYYVIFKKQMSKAELDSLFNQLKVVNPGFLMIGYDVRAAIKPDYKIKNVTISTEQYLIRRCSPIITLVEFEIYNPGENVWFTQTQASEASPADIQEIMNKLAQQGLVIDVGQTPNSLTYEQVIARLVSQDIITPKSDVVSDVLTGLFQEATPQAVEQVTQTITQTSGTSIAAIGKGTTTSKYLPLIIVAAIVVIVTFILRR